MANNELIIAGNHDMTFRQEQFMEARQNSELYPTQDYNFALEHIHETNLQIGVSREQSEVWNHNEEQALTVQNSRIYSEEQGLQGKDEVDSQENGNESYDQAFELSFPDNDDSETSENDKLALIVSEDLNDNLQLAVGHCMNSDPMPCLELAPPPILQNRSLVAAPEHDLVIGMEFSDVLACRRALRDAAIASRFEMQTVKSDKTRFTAKCTSEGCPWRIHCAKLPGVPTFTIRTIHGSHTCNGISHLGHHQASVQWVAEAVQERLKENPHCKPKEILEEIHQVHGITLSYKQAWRGKERIMAAVRGSFEEEYRLLPRYCEEIKRANPGSIAVVNGNPDGSFRRLFISFQASIYGFVNACRHLIVLDRVVLKNKYLGTLLLATAFDGDGGTFPLAFALIAEDNDESSNWEWFLSELSQLLEVNSENMPKLTILSSKEKPIVEGVKTYFEPAFHGVCIHHLAEWFRREFNISIHVNFFWEAAKCLTESDFEAKINELEQISPEAVSRIRDISSVKWTSNCFERTRFGPLTPNVTESLSSWIQESLPIIQMTESIRRQLMTLINERREMSKNWSFGILVPSAERRVNEAIEQSGGYQVQKANEEQQFEVMTMTSEETFTVNISSRSCTCRGWDVHGLPCSHAAAALLSCRQNVHRFTKSCFTVANYQRTYSQTIHPVPDKTMWKKTEAEGENGEEFVIRPPRLLIQQQPRPRKRRSQGEDRGHQKRVVRCSRCGQPGHFRTTCTAPI